MSFDFIKIFSNYFNLNDNNSLMNLYSAADATVVPSRQESFCQTASESHACGTPVVGFNIGGLNDIVDHLRTGYLAKAFDAQISVSALAKAQTLEFSGFSSKTESINLGSIAIDFGSWSGDTFSINSNKASQSVTVSSANNTLDGLR